MRHMGKRGFGLNETRRPSDTHALTLLPCDRGESCACDECGFEGACTGECRLGRRQRRRRRQHLERRRGVFRWDEWRSWRRRRRQRLWRTRRCAEESCACSGEFPTSDRLQHRVRLVELTQRLRQGHLHPVKGGGVGRTGLVARQTAAFLFYVVAFIIISQR